MPNKTQPLVLPVELADRVAALARATDNDPAVVLERLVEHALGDGESLGIAADLPREVVLVRLHDLSHAGGELADLSAAAASLLDNLDDGEFEQADLVDELADLVDDAGVGRARLVAWLRQQLERDFRGGGNA